MNEVTPVQAAWTLSDSGTVAAFAISLVALLLSWFAYRQRVRFHAQPKLVFEWSKGLQPTNNGLFVREGSIVNHGDASARDLRVKAEFMVEGEFPWHRQDVLEPGGRIRLSLPVVDGVSQGFQGGVLVYERHADPTTYRFVTPRVTVRWRQAPFRGKQHQMTERAPHTPNLLKGESA